MESGPKGLLEISLLPVRLAQGVAHIAMEELFGLKKPVRDIKQIDNFTHQKEYEIDLRFSPDQVVETAVHDVDIDLTRTKPSSDGLAEQQVETAT